MNLDFFRNIESSTKENKLMKDMIENIKLDLENKLDDNEEFVIDRFEGDLPYVKIEKQKKK